MGAFLVDDELVVGRAPGMMAGAYDQRPQVRQRAFVSQDGLLVERGCRQVPVDVVEIVQTMVFHAVGTVFDIGVVHVVLL